MCTLMTVLPADSPAEVCVCASLSLSLSLSLPLSFSLSPSLFLSLAPTPTSFLSRAPPSPLLCIHNSQLRKKSRPERNVCDAPRERLRKAARMLRSPCARHVGAYVYIYIYIYFYNYNTSFSLSFTLTLPNLSSPACPKLQAQ